MIKNKDGNLVYRSYADMEANEDIKILEGGQKDTGWLEAVVCGRLVSAKIYDMASEYGITGFGRISKISILKTADRDLHKAYFPQCDLNYDRGLDFNHMWKKDRKLYFKIIKTLEKLPTLEYVYGQVSQ